MKWGALFVVTISVFTVALRATGGSEGAQLPGTTTASFVEALGDVVLPEPAAPPSSPVASEPVAVVVPETGPGTFVIAGGTNTIVGAPAQVTAYRVEVEDGLPESAQTFASSVDQVLADDRGWTKTGRYAFGRTADAELRIVLASPATTDQLCAPLETRGNVSCRNGNVVAINARRWYGGAETYGPDLEQYRTYLLNHEVGHALGFPHASCPSAGAPAPVMVQQTLGLQGCEPNPWP